MTAQIQRGAGALIAIFLLSACGTVAANGNTTTSQASAAANATDSSSTTAAITTTTVAVRQAIGKPVTLGAGSFTGGTNVAVGLYDVTTVNGQSGNFIVTGTDNIDEILGVTDGIGVPKIRTPISTGDSIQIENLSQVIFTPVSTPYVTSHSTVNLYAGTFTVGQDIGAGRYVATTPTGDSGNFIVTGTDNVDEILGVTDGIGVPSVTTNLTNGDTIQISGLSQVTMTAVN